MNEGKLNNVTKEELLKYYNEGWSYESIGAIYGVSGTSIKKKLIKFGVSLPKKRKISKSETFNKGVKFTAQNYCLNCGKPVANNYKYCCINCQREYQYQQHIKDWKEHPEKYTAEKAPNYIRKYLFEKYNNSCQICGWHEINPTTGKSPLEIHHINGDCSDNREENLQLLCPNCHSLTPTMGILNKGNSKRYKYKTYRKEISNLTENKTVKIW